jgi:hypothetical protein
MHSPESRTVLQGEQVVDDPLPSGRALRIQGPRILAHEPPGEPAAAVAQEPIETLIAADPIPTFQDPPPGPDAFIWQHDQDQSEWLSPPAVAEPIETLIAADPIPSTQDPALDPDFFIWDHKQEQNEWTAPPLAADEVMAAVDLGGLSLDPDQLLPPDFFVWKHDQEQNEARSPRVTLSNTAEGGTDEASVTVANSGGASGDAWDFVDDAFQSPPGTMFGASLRYSSAQKADTLSYRIDENFSFVGANMRWTSSGKIQRSQNQLFVRGYFWVSRPALNDTLFFQMSSGDALAKCGFTNDSRFLVGDQAAVLVGSPGEMRYEQWIRVEMQALRGNELGLPNQTMHNELRIYYDPNSAGPADVTLTRDSFDNGDIDFDAAIVGIDSSDSLYTYYVDNIGLDTNDWLGPLGTFPTGVAQPSLTVAGHPHDVVQPWEADDFRLWEHEVLLHQNEFLSPFSEAIENLIAADPMEGLELNPLPDPDFFQWNQPQDIGEAVIPPGLVAEPIEVLVGADMMSTGHPPDLVDPAGVFDLFDQNTDPPAGTIPPDLSGNIRRVPRWAKQRNFYAGGR